MRYKPKYEKIKTKILHVLAYVFLFLIRKTLRYKIVGTEHRQLAETISLNKNFIFAGWHQNLISTLAVIILKKEKKLCALVSNSYDGEILSKILNRLGISTSRGSSNRRGQRALLQLIRFINKGFNLIIAVDGPRGPKYQVKPGILYLAYKKNIPILPIIAIPRRCWVLRSTWDHLRIPKPFSTLHVEFGKPIVIPKGLNKENITIYQEELNSQLMLIENKYHNKKNT